jgi:hypothetical protein
MTSFSVISFKKAISVFQEDFVQIPTQKSRILCFCQDGPIMRPNAHQCQKLLNSSSVHLFGCHGNTSLEFEKIPVFLCRHGLGRQLASVRTTGQHCPDVVLDKEITCRQFATIQTLGQHRLDAALIWKRVKRIIERWLHSSPSGRSMLPSRCGLEKSETDSFEVF